MNSPARILIADDNPANRDILEKRLALHGYEIITARDGAEALRLATIAVNLTGRSNPQLLDTLAAALAEQERYDDAVTTLQQALANAKSHALFRLVSEIEARRRLYQQGRPYRIDESATGGRQ